ncbi:MAG: HAD-IA family hydrolase [Candidatus Rariloculaceae bacterium]
MRIKAVLMDLDGTFADTAPDLVGALNAMLLRHSLPRVPYAIARNEVSNGSLALLKLGFGEIFKDNQIEPLQQEFLKTYKNDIATKSSIFKGLDSFVDNISSLGMRWGIVTNKPKAMTNPLLKALNISNEPACVISGDRLPQRKPHPAPLLLAADKLDLPPESCIYIGDAARDIEAGRAAKMRTIAVTYGYIRPHQDPYSWGADIVISRPSELLNAVARLDI